MSDEAAVDAAQYETIRLFPDYVRTVLWLDQPIHYDRTGLSSELVKELEAWEQSYYDSLTDDIAWKSAGHAHAYTVEGARLAACVAAEAGPRFVAEFDSSEDGAETVYARTKSPALNAAAEASFIRLQEEWIAEDQRVADLLAESNGSWTAYAPLSGQTFTPASRAERSEDHD